MDRTTRTAAFWGAALALTTAASAALSACGAPAKTDMPKPHIPSASFVEHPVNGSPDDKMIETTVPLSDGRKVVCVVYRGDRQGGTSCDWANATR